MTAERSSQTLGKYEILGELGKGGFAAVFRARDCVLHRDVALKVLHPALVADPDFVRRFEDDARSAAHLDHPHIVTVYDLGQSEGRFFIAMQLLPGGSLADVLEHRGPLPFERALSVVEQVARALDYAHERGFVHRDVKPSNILFDAHGEAVVTDFGLAKAAESSVIARSTAGGIVGTPAYIAPEVWEEGEVGPATDVYALGCVLFEMLHGQRMFRGQTTPAVMRAHFQPHEYPEAWPEGVPAELEGILERALEPEARERYPSAGALADDLRHLSARAADPLAVPYQALLEALAAEEWERSLYLAEEIAAQNPDYHDVSALRKQAADARASAERARWAAQWRRQALEAEEEGDVEAAQLAARRWLEMMPEAEEAKALLERVTVLERPSLTKIATRTGPSLDLLLLGAGILLIVTGLTAGVFFFGPGLGPGRQSPTATASVSSGIEETPVAASPVPTSTPRESGEATATPRLGLNLLEPRDGATLTTDQQVNFEWRLHGGLPELFDFVVRTDRPGFEELCRIGQQSCSWSLDPDVYEWWVEIWSGGNLIRESDRRTLEVQAQPAETPRPRR